MEGDRSFEQKGSPRETVSSCRVAHHWYKKERKSTNNGGGKSSPLHRAVFFPDLAALSDERGRKRGKR